jgi:hypothetical protein
VSMLNPPAVYGVAVDPAKPWDVDLTVDTARALLDSDAYLRDIIGRIAAGETVTDLWHGTEVFYRWVLARSLGNTRAVKPVSSEFACCEAGPRTRTAHTWNPYFSTPYWSSRMVCDSPAHDPWTTNDPTKNPAHSRYDGPIPVEFRCTNNYAPELEFPARRRW